MKTTSRILILFLSLALFSQIAEAQTQAQTEIQAFSNKSIKTSFGIGMNEGDDEIGIGTVFSLAYQKAVWKNRLRLGPYILTGGFMPIGITDTREQFYRITSLGFNGYLDVLKYKPVSLFIWGGGFVNYSRGVLGTGGWPEEGNTRSEYFLNFYGGGSFGSGIRIDPPNRRIAYEITPFNFNFGNSGFMLAYFRVGIDIKLN